MTRPDEANMHIFVTAMVHLPYCNNTLTTSPTPATPLPLSHVTAEGIFQFKSDHTLHISNIIDTTSIECATALWANEVHKCKGFSIHTREVSWVDSCLCSLFDKPFL